MTLFIMHKFKKFFKIDIDSIDDNLFFFIINDFLDLTTNVALNKSRSNIDTEFFVNKMGSEDSAKGKLFKKIYDEKYLEAKAQGLDNPQKLAVMSALKIIGANGRTR